jgi:hypothetical protein
MFKSMKKSKKSKHAVGDLVGAEIDYNNYVIGIISGIKEVKGTLIYNIYWSDDMDKGDTYTIENIEAYKEIIDIMHKTKSFKIKHY